MKVLLIRPNWTYPITKSESTYNRVWPPLSLVNCASLLTKADHKVKIIDAQANNISINKLANKAKSYDYIFATSSSLDRWQCPNLDISPIVKTAKAIRKQNENLFIMGYHGTVMPRKILNLTGAKAVIRGEPEMIVLKICSGKSLKQVCGLTYKQNGKIISSKSCQPFELSKLPIPAFKLLDFSKYKYEILGDNFALLEFSRGCPFNCIFCDKDVMYQPGIRKKSISQVKKEIEYLVEKCKVSNIYFFDLEFNVLGQDYISKICNFVIKKGYNFRWCCQLRADKIQSKIIKLMKQAGCVLIHCGVETGSKNTMKQINKAFSIDAISQGITNIKNAGIDTLGFFIIGFPWETSKNIWQTIWHARSMDLTYASFHLANPYPKTKLEKYGKRRNITPLFINESSSPTISTNQLRLLSKIALLIFYSKPKRILQVIRSGNLSTKLKFFLNYIFKK